MVANCSEYYSFENYLIIKHDIYTPDFASINKNELEKIINYYYPSVIIECQKIQNVKCKIWDKNKEIDFYLTHMVSNL